MPPPRVPLGVTSSVIFFSFTIPVNKRINGFSILKNYMFLINRALIKSKRMLIPKRGAKALIPLCALATKGYLFSGEEVATMNHEGKKKGR